ncbi:DUF4868 domain-containing protein [Marinobacter sp. TBZ242]|uniref:DUF4868 domain-containing protein n=1 Tax=Marinobacter azerbaijanicus TaxID=3050455 RepID=A0ABT7IHL8_9GAMM|nr:Kiwa anti-phage protein KwaB-like domain-containing protein [Marinobacter sp. TBZ242]MDL0433670.1 DUF4868 domain-containing protein [Marinobacter sp. TBZ242]
MTIENLKSRVSEIISRDDCSAEFFFLIDNNDGMNVKSVEIVDGDHMELEALFMASVSDSILLDDNLSLIELSSADDRRDALYRYDLEEIPSQLEYLKEIIENESFETFDFTKDSLSHLEGILILLGNEESQIAIYKHQYPISLMKKDSGVFNLMKPNGGSRFKKLDVDILKINKKFEFFKVDGQYYILDIKALERFFGFLHIPANVNAHSG